MATGLDLVRAYTAIAGAARDGMNDAINIAQTSAIQRVPVRRVFAGGRRSPSRVLTQSELFRDVHQFYGSEAVGQVRKLAAARAGTQTRPKNSDRANRGWQAWRLRALNELPPETSRSEDEVDLSEPRSLSEEGMRQLSSRGRYELKSGRAFTRSGGIEHLGGRLKESIHIEEGEETVARYSMRVVAGGKDAPYAKYVEFGTRHAAAQPFMRPALKTAEGRYRELLVRRLSRLGRAGETFTVTLPGGGT